MKGQGWADWMTCPALYLTISPNSRTDGRSTAFAEHTFAISPSPLREASLGGSKGHLDNNAAATTTESQRLGSCRQRGANPGQVQPKS